jgi:hypothetical protein
MRSPAYILAACSHGSSTGPPDLEENRFSIALSALGY